MGFILLILLFIIIANIYLNNERHTNETVSNFYSHVHLYEKIYESFSKMELLKLFYERNNQFINMWHYVVGEHNKDNSNMKIVFEKYDLFNNENYIEFDTQADILIAQTYGVDWISKFRAICNLLERIDNIKGDDKTIYNGKTVEYDEIPFEDNLQCVLCTKKRLNELINSNINADIFNLFNYLNNGNYDKVLSFFNGSNDIMHAYPGLSTYLLNNILDKFVNYYDKYINEWQLYDIIEEAIDSSTLVMEEINSKEFIKYLNYLIENNLKIEILDKFYDNYKDDDNIYSVVEEIWDASYNCVELFKYFNTKKYFTYEISWRKLYVLSINNRFLELKFVLENLKIDRNLHDSCITLNKKTYDEICYDTDIYIDDVGNEQYKVEILETNFFEAIELNKKIDIRIKVLIKEYFNDKYINDNK